MVLSHGPRVEEREPPLIVAAIFFKDMPIRSALASSHGEASGFSCVEYDTGGLIPHAMCYLSTNTTLREFIPEVIILGSILGVFGAGNRESSSLV